MSRSSERRGARHAGDRRVVAGGCLASDSTRRLPLPRRHRPPPSPAPLPASASASRRPRPEIAGVGHRRAPRRHGTAARQGHGGEGTGRLRREVRVLPRHVRREQRLHGADRRRGIAGQRPAASARPAASSTTRRRSGTTSTGRCRSTRPRRCRVEEVYALTAYVLHLDDLLPADGVARPRQADRVQDAQPRRDDAPRTGWAPSRASPTRATSHA